MGKLNLTSNFHSSIGITISNLAISSRLCLPSLHRLIYARLFMNIITTFIFLKHDHSHNRVNPSNTSCAYKINQFHNLGLNLIKFNAFGLHFCIIFGFSCFLLPSIWPPPTTARSTTRPFEGSYPGMSNSIFFFLDFQALKGH